MAGPLGAPASGMAALQVAVFLLDLPRNTSDGTQCKKHPHPETTMRRRGQPTSALLERQPQRDWLRNHSQLSVRPHLLPLETDLATETQSHGGSRMEDNLCVVCLQSSIFDLQSLWLRVSVAEDWLLLKPRMTWYHSSAGGSNGIRKPGSRNGSVLRHWMGDVKAACRSRLRPPSCSPARGQAPRARLGSFTPNGPKHR